MKNTTEPAAAKPNTTIIKDLSSKMKRMMTTENWTYLTSAYTQNNNVNEKKLNANVTDMLIQSVDLNQASNKIYSQAYEDAIFSELDNETTIDNSSMMIALMTLNSLTKDKAGHVEIKSFAQQKEYAVEKINHVFDLIEKTDGNMDYRQVQELVLMIETTEGLNEGDKNAINIKLKQVAKSNFKHGLETLNRANTFYKNRYELKDELEEVKEMETTPEEIANVPKNKIKTYKTMKEIVLNYVNNKTNSETMTLGLLKVLYSDDKPGKGKISANEMKALEQLQKFMEENHDLDMLGKMKDNLPNAKKNIKKTYSQQDRDRIHAFLNETDINDEEKGNKETKNISEMLEETNKPEEKSKKIQGRAQTPTIQPQ